MLAAGLRLGPAKDFEKKEEGGHKEAKSGLAPSAKVPEAYKTLQLAIALQVLMLQLKRFSSVGKAANAQQPGGTESLAGLPHLKPAHMELQPPDEASGSPCIKAGWGL
ncbi:hypothetical protein ABBQ32_002585 [Trebouxia sp. C0010 RCD-2024]